MAVAGVRDDALKMQADIEELNNSVTHLLRSNDELRAALEDEPADRDFLDAVAENELVVQKRRREVADLERKLEALTGHSMRSVPSAAPVHPAAEAAASAAGGQDERQGEVDPVAASAGAATAVAAAAAALVPSSYTGGSGGVDGRSGGAGCDGSRGGGPALGGAGIFL